MTYDALSRLSIVGTNGSSGFPRWALSLTYDRFGNRTAQTVTAGAAPGNSVAISTATNRITDAGYGYDANGNMTSDGSNTATFNAENRLVTSTGSLGAGQYVYDGKGLRVKKIAGATTTVYIFSGSKVIAEYENGAIPAAPTRQYIYVGATPIAKLESGATNYFHADQSSVRAITDASGALLGQQGNYPFGEAWYAGSTSTKWRFTSYERDAESGNDYATARNYVNRLGRFSSADMFSGVTSNPQSLNKFSYVQDDPINSVDPSGQLMIPGFGWINFGPAEQGYQGLESDLAIFEHQNIEYQYSYTGAPMGDAHQDANSQDQYFPNGIDVQTSWHFNFSTGLEDVTVTFLGPPVLRSDTWTPLPGPKPGEPRTLRPRTSKEYDTCKQQAAAAQQQSLLTAQIEILGGVVAIEAGGYATAEALPVVYEVFNLSGPLEAFELGHSYGAAYFGALAPLVPGYLYVKGIRDAAKAYDHYDADLIHCAAAVPK